MMLLDNSQSVIAEEYRDSEQDQKDWMKVVCSTICTLIINKDILANGSNDALPQLSAKFFSNPAFF